MKRSFVAGLITLIALPAFSGAGKSCEELKSEIQAKIEAKGVKKFTLDIVPKDSVAEGAKVVGSCEGGTKRIVYTRN